MDQRKYKIEPLVSIVMCAYNTKPFIEIAVKSILQQTYKNWELIISDDASTDGTREWLSTLAGHPKVKLFLHKKNIGYVENKNFSVDQARGEYITQNDSDDFSDPARLEKQMSVLQKHPSTKIIACGYYIVDTEGSVYRTVHSDKNKWISEPAKEYPFWFPALVCHREVYQETGKFSSLFCGMGDDHYWTAKANEKYPIYCLSEPLYFYRNNPDSITNVLNDKRKLIVSPLIEELLRQRKETGTDWLEKKDMNAIQQFEQSLLLNKKFMAERYRIWAASAISQHRYPVAKSFLKEAVRLFPFSIKLIKTIGYYCRKKIGIS